MKLLLQGLLLSALSVSVTSAGHHILAPAVPATPTKAGIRTVVPMAPVRLTTSAEATPIDPDQLAKLNKKLVFSAADRNVDSGQ
jgi:hypothetical protein